MTDVYWVLQDSYKLFETALKEHQKQPPNLIGDKFHYFSDDLFGSQLESILADPQYGIRYAAVKDQERQWSTMDRLWIKEKNINT